MRCDCHVQIGPGDIRHTLQTLSQLCASPSAPPSTRTVVYEDSAELLSRHVVLLAMALDTSLPLRSRMEQLLEVHGNALLQEKTAAYMSAPSNVLTSSLRNLLSLAWPWFT